MPDKHDDFCQACQAPRQTGLDCQLTGLSLLGVRAVRSEFLQRLGIAMKRAALSMQALDAKAGLSKGYLSRVFSGERKRLRVGTIEKLAEATGVRVAWLAVGEESMIGSDAPVTARRMPELESAIAFHGPMIGPEAIARARREAELDSRSSWAKLAWIKRLLEIQREVLDEQQRRSLEVG